MKKLTITIALLALALLLSACRVRTTLLEPENAEEPAAPVRIDAVVEPEPDPEPQKEQEPEPEPEPPQEPEAEPQQEQEPEPEREAVQPDAPEEQDESSERRTYAPDASGELTPEAETPLNRPEDGTEGTPVPTGGEGGPVNVEQDGAERTATETVPADEAEQLGVDESGETAESELTYYLTLLDSRLGSLFECKRLYVYWETEEDYRTVHRSSREHQMILGAGAYDVAAKLLEENLTVGDGWVARKNPDAVVKIVDGALEPLAAQALCGELSARSEWAGINAVREGRLLILSGRLLDTQAGQTAAMLSLAKLLYPEQLEDVDLNEALRTLLGETGGAYVYP